VFSHLEQERADGALLRLLQPRLAGKAALATREVIELAGAKDFCKTSGATGLHIQIPMGYNGTGSVVHATP
jgi:DNA primase